MDDLILSSRLDSLEQNLTQIVGNSAWLRDCVLKRYVPQQLMPQQSGTFSDSWPEQVWDELDATVVTKANELKRNLADIRKLVDEAGKKKPEDAVNDFNKAWQLYKEIYEDSQEVFSECLEYMSGLALRDRGFDQKICDIADKLIVACGKDWNNLTWQSLTVLAAQEKLGQTLARIIRLRFPEWTIWTLPFTAREFAHVALHANQNEAVLEFVKRQVDELTKKEPRLVKERQANSPADTIERLEMRARRYAKNHIHELVADAFATYTLGPAYACAAILLRLSPIEGGADGFDHPTDAKRAEVILGILKRMNVREPEQMSSQPPFTDIIKRLEDEWNAARERALPATSERAATTQRLEDLIDVDELITGIWNAFSNKVRLPARFPDEDPENGWLKALEWQRRLMNNLRSSAPARQDIPVTRTSKLRDALNAAWLCRIYVTPTDKVDIKRISEAALELCERIINPPIKPDGGSSMLVPSASPGPGGLPPGQVPFK